MLVRNPGVSCAAILALALGIGGTTAIFSAVYAVLLKPLPFRDPGRLVAVWEKDESRQRERSLVSPANFRDWKQQSRVFEDLCAIHDLHVNVTGGPGGKAEPEEVQGERVSAGLFDLLGVRALIGRTFTREEGEPGKNAVAVIGYTLWKRRFAGDPAILGKSIRVSGFIWTVVGVMPPDFHVLNRHTEVWVPILFEADAPGARSRRYLAVLGRLKPGVALRAARTEMDSIGRRLAAAYPEADRGWGVTMLSLADEVVGDVRVPMLVLLAAVLLLLLMACVNAANLLLARAVARQNEIALRVSLGAGRGRIARQLFTESVMLALAGGAAGLGLAYGGTRLLATIAPPDIPRLAQAAVDGRMLVCTVLVSIATGVLFGLAPALGFLRAGLAGRLRQTARGLASGRGAVRLRSGLVIAEVALAMILLVGAGLLIRSFLNLRSVDPGLNPANVLTIRVLITSGANAAESRRIDFFRQAVDRIASLPGVLSAGSVSFLPNAGFGTGAFFTVEGRATAPDAKPLALLRSADPGYFRTLGIRLLAGRAFTPADGRGNPRVAVVNDTLVRRFWGSPREALGRRIRIDFRRPELVEIIGVTADVKAEGLNSPTWAMIYCPHAQAPSPSMVLVARTAGDPLGLAAAAAHEVYALDPEQPVAEVRSMEQVLDDAMAAHRFQTLLLLAFAAVALLLAAGGIYGLMAYSVTERTREIGIRMALGARPGEVLRAVVARGAILAGIGLVAGLGASFGLMRLLSTLLFGVPPTDPATFAGAAALLLGVAAAAAWIPARRAAQIAPMIALRHE